MKMLNSIFCACLLLVEVEKVAKVDDVMGRAKFNGGPAAAGNDYGPGLTHRVINVGLANDLIAK